MKHVEPPSPELSTRIPLFMIGKDSRGNWVVQDQQGICGGLFINRVEALRFAMFENGNRPQAVIMVPGVFELDMSRRADPEHRQPSPSTAARDRPRQHPGRRTRRPGGQREDRSPARSGNRRRRAERPHPATCVRGENPVGTRPRSAADRGPRRPRATQHRPRRLGGRAQRRPGVRRRRRRCRRRRSHRPRTRQHARRRS